MARSGVPRTWSLPSSKTMSSSLTSSRAAAILARLLLHLSHRQQHGRAADRSPAAAERADSLGGDGGVAGLDDHVFHRDAELIRHDLREGRLLTLAVGRDAGRDHHGAGRLHQRRAAVPTGTGQFAVDRHAKPDQSSLGARRGLLGPHRVVVDAFHASVSARS